MFSFLPFKDIINPLGFLCELVDLPTKNADLVIVHLSVHGVEDLLLQVRQFTLDFIHIGQVRLQEVRFVLGENLGKLGLYGANTKIQSFIGLLEGGILRIV